MLDCIRDVQLSWLLSLCPTIKNFYWLPHSKVMIINNEEFYLFSIFPALITVIIIIIIATIVEFCERRCREPQQEPSQQSPSWQTCLLVISLAIQYTTNERMNEQTNDETNEYDMTCQTANVKQCHITTTFLLCRWNDLKHPESRHGSSSSHPWTIFPLFQGFFSIFLIMFNPVIFNCSIPPIMLFPHSAVNNLRSIFLGQLSIPGFTRSLKAWGDIIAVGKKGKVFTAETEDQVARIRKKSTV